MSSTEVDLIGELNDCVDAKISNIIVDIVNTVEVGAGATIPLTAGDIYQDLQVFGADMSFIDENFVKSVNGHFKRSGFSTSICVEISNLKKDGIAHHASCLISVWKLRHL